MNTYLDVLEALRVRVDTIRREVDTVYDAHYCDRDQWTDADEQECEGALESLATAFPHDAHLFRALELSQKSRVANVLDMAADSVCCAKRFDDAVPLAARTVESAIAEVSDADWHDGGPVSVREISTGQQVAEVSGGRPGPQG